ncbi:MAG: hypothetical protein KBT48_04265 [Firmicutes bacterium]|nr:hypothetical protein [Bacillota bacterium]
MKKLSLFVCMGLLASSLVGCGQVNEVMENIGFSKPAEKEEIKDSSKKEDTTTEAKEESTEVKEETKAPEADTEVHEVTMEELLNNGAQYEGKHIRVRGYLPEGKVADATGKEVFGVIADDGVNYIEITGKEPTIHNCTAWVMGVAKMVENEIVIEGTDFALIEQLGNEPVTQVEEQPLLQPEQPQQPQQPQEQLYYYRIINGERVFQTAEGQRIWDARQKKEQNEE